MATEEEKIILRIEGQEELQRLIAAKEREEAAVKTAIAAHRQAVQTYGAMSAAASQASLHLNANASALAATEKAVKAQREALAASTRDFGRATLEVSRGLEDLQYGVAGVLNNIPGTVAAFGGSAGLAGTLSMVAVAAKVLYDHWDDLQSLFGESKTKSEAEQMDELAKATKRTADEEERLARFKALEGKTKELAGAKTEGEAKAEKAATEAITEAGVRNVAEGVRRTAPEKLDALIPVDVKDAMAKARQRLANAEAMQKAAPGTGWEREVAEGRERVIKADKEYADAQRKAAATITSAAAATKFFSPEALADLVRKNPDAFGPGAHDLIQGLQVARMQRDRPAGAAEAEKAWAKEAREHAAAVKKEDALAEALNDQGFDNKKFFDDKYEREGMEAVRKENRNRDEARKNEDVSFEFERFALGADPATVKKRKAEAERKAKEATRDATPDLDHMADLARANELLGGRAADKDAMARQLVLASGSTLSLKEARAQVDDSFKESDGRLKAKARQVFENQQPLRSSETYDASEIARRTQAGVGGPADEMKKHTNLLERAVAALVSIERKKPLAAGARR